MNNYDKIRRIKLAKSRKTKKNRMTADNAVKVEDLSRRIRIIDEYKLTPAQEMLDACTLHEKTLARLTIHCNGLTPITLDTQMSDRIIREIIVYYQQQRQQYVDQIMAIE